MKELEDHELHIEIDYKGITYTYEVLGKVTVRADNLYVGSQDISKYIFHV